MGNANSNQRTFIYALIDPSTNEVFYIGRSNKPKNRLTQHILRSNKLAPGLKKFNNTQVRIQAILRAEQAPILQVLEETLGRFADKREVYWCNHYREQGVTLTNQSIIQKQYSYDELLVMYKKVKRDRDELIYAISRYLRPLVSVGTRFEWVMKYLKTHQYGEKE